MPIWNPWHGCHKISPGCQNCYVYRRDESIGKDASVVTRTGDHALPLKKDRHGEYKLRAEDGTVFTCMTSDFFLPDADGWRGECWDIIRKRSDLHFHIITKRIERFEECAPPDWGSGWDNVTVCSTCEDQQRVDQRLPVLLSLPIKHRQVISEPMLGEIDIERYLATGLIEHVTCGGESGDNARVCDFRWVKELRRQCVRCGVSFTFKQTGARFLKDGRLYHIERRLQMPQAKKSCYSYTPGTGSAEGIRYTLPERGQLFSRLAGSKFRSGFRLTDKDRQYIAEKGTDVIRSHAADFVRTRLAPENPPNDGKQTPMRGHPVFPAQHATACCCRSCLEKWHGIPSGKVLNEAEQRYIVSVIMDWIEMQLVELIVDNG